MNTIKKVLSVLALAATCLATEAQPTTNNGPAPAGTTGGSGTVTTPFLQKATIGWPYWLDTGSIYDGVGVFGDTSRSNFFLSGGINTSNMSVMNGVTITGSNSFRIKQLTPQAPTNAVYGSNAMAGIALLVAGAVTLTNGYRPGDLIFLTAISNASAVAITNGPMVFSTNMNQVIVTSQPAVAANSNWVQWFIIGQ